MRRLTKPLPNRQRRANALGIIVCSTNKYPPFSERVYYEQLSRIGRRLGIAVVVFSPKHIDWRTRRVRGYRHHHATNKWVKVETDIPGVIYDRCFYVTSAHYLSYKPYVQLIERDPFTELLGLSLKGKWQLAQIVSRAPNLTAYMPSTERYTKPTDAEKYLHQYGAFVAKPSGGSQGNGIVAIFHHKQGNTYAVLGRSKKNEPLAHTFATETTTFAWLHQFIGKSRYILQPYLHLHTPDNTPFDVRALMQKDERRTWQLTGMAVRTGNRRSLTSNLHGGGKAEPFAPFLHKLSFDAETMRQIERHVHTICKEVPPLIEREHGRLCELGIDIGIDRQGRVWLLEVNSKPGRHSFQQAGTKDIYYTAVKRPMLYAHSLLQSK
ncbi:YheC/YheD family endospore coat-associated protein [Numidum massiliense]|uniref:YheC/YheD family endospore coat-associated protein n=1 Tax=Numidum massiliense TaxID=1522315 RepID=UPI0006D5AAE4|nr:YheC/YheD family protein [Numidum massiliense]